MVLMKLLTFFVAIQKTVSDIHLKGGKTLNLFLLLIALSNPLIIFFWTLDCDVSKIFENSSNFPDWSPCLNLKNRSNECGEGITNPFKEYSDIVTKDKWVSFVRFIYILLQILQCQYENRFHTF